MKKIFRAGAAALCLFATVHCARAEDSRPVFRGIDFYTGATLKCPEEGMRKSELKADGGVGLRFKDAVLMASLGMPFTAFNAVDISRTMLGGKKAGKKSDKKAIERYGAYFHLDGTHFCFDTTLYAGTLRFGKGMARLKKPSLASAAPLRNLSLLSPGLSPALPGFRSATSPFALALSCQPAAPTPFLPSMDFAYFENGDRALSLYKEFPLASGKKTKLSLAATGGAFAYSRKLSSAWFPAERYIPRKAYAASDMEICLSLAEFFSSSNAFGMTENPFGGAADAFFWARTQDSFHIKGFACNTAFFYARTADMLLPTGKKLNIKRQTQFNPQFSFELPCGCMRAGVEVERSEKLSSGKSPCPYTDYALKMALSYQCGKIQTDAQWNRKVTGKKHAVSYQARLAFRYRSVAFISRTTAVYGISAQGESFGCTQAFSFSHGMVSSIKGSVTASFKNGGYAGGKCSASIGFSGAWGHTRWQGTVSFSTSF